ncbi:hypothetical protein NL676_003320 [Syzygium grande]|nr:hypothetical protein NL676_003320 [Syzygium grande]
METFGRPRTYERVPDGPRNIAVPYPKKVTDLVQSHRLQVVQSGRTGVQIHNIPARWRGSEGYIVPPEFEFDAHQGFGFSSSMIKSLYKDPSHGSLGGRSSGINDADDDGDGDGNYLQASLLLTLVLLSAFVMFYHNCVPIGLLLFTTRRCA